MLREVLRSTLYSSSRPFSSSATRRSSFSTLTISLLPVLRTDRPKILSYLVYHNSESCFIQSESGQVDACSLLAEINLMAGARRAGVGVGAGAVVVATPKSLSKKLLAAPEPERRRAEHAARAPHACNLAGGVGFRFHIRLRHRRRPFAPWRRFGWYRRLLSSSPPRLASSVADRLDQLERISLMRGCEPGDLHFEFAFILRESALENAGCDRPRDFAAVPRSALHHDRDDILRVIVRRETGKPGDVLLLAVDQSPAPFRFCQRPTRLSSALCRRSRRLRSRLSTNLA